MCVCYTNHALDQFLEDIIVAGVPTASVVRVGGRSKSTKLSACELFRASAGEQSRLAPGARAHAYELRTKIEELSADITAGTRTALTQGVQDVPYDTIASWLQDNDPAATAAFPGQAGVVGAAVPGLRDNPDGWQRAGDALQEGDMWQRWLRGQNSAGRSDHALWRLTRAERRATAAGWVAQLVAECREGLGSDLEECAWLLEDKQHLYSHADCKRLYKAQVIGCTTTGAAKYRCDLSESCDCCSGEVYESESTWPWVFRSKQAAQTHLDR
jgi:hypothetical protein